jgi:hypothetical protein
MQASPGQEDDYTLLLPWPPGVRIARLCLFHVLFLIPWPIPDYSEWSVSKFATSSRGLYHRDSRGGKCGRPCPSRVVDCRVRGVEVCTTIPQSVVDVRFRFPHRKARPKLK